MSARAVRLTKVDIDNALSNSHLETVFQPILHLKSGAILRHEVFVRWDHPGLGNLPPGAFISFFEGQGRIGELTRYVLRHAINAYNRWEDPQGGLSINLSLSDLRDQALPGDIERLLTEAQFAPDALTLECPPFPPEIPVEHQLALYGKLAAVGCPLSLEVRTRSIETLKMLDPFPFAEIKTGGDQRAAVCQEQPRCAWSFCAVRIVDLRQIP